MNSLSPTSFVRATLTAGLLLVGCGAAGYSVAPARQQQEQLPAAATTATQTQPATQQQPPPAANDAAPATTTTTTAAAAQSEDGDAERLPFMRDDRAQQQQQEAGQRQQGAEEASGSLNLLARTIGALLLIVGLIFGAGWALRKFGGARFNARPDAERGPALAVLSTMSIGDRRTLTVVKFGERTLLVGSTPQAVTLLAEEDSLPPTASDRAAQSSAPAALSASHPDSQPAAPRSVAEMLDGEEVDSFSDELIVAERRFEATAAAAAPLTAIWNEQRRRRGGEGGSTL